MTLLVIIYKDNGKLLPRREEVLSANNVNNVFTLRDTAPLQHAPTLTPVNNFILYLIVYTYSSVDDGKTETTLLNRFGLVFRKIY